MTDGDNTLVIIGLVEHPPRERVGLVSGVDLLPELLHRPDQPAVDLLLDLGALGGRSPSAASETGDEGAGSAAVGFRATEPPSGPWPQAREGATQRAQERTLRQEMLTGLERLTAVTALLRRIRLQDPRGGVWEAADMQWWWRHPRVSDEIAAPVWFDDADQPIAAALLTDWTKAWWLDLLRLPGVALDELAGPAWAALERQPDAPTLEALVPADDAELRAWFEGRGFAAIEESWSGWQAAEDRPAVAALPAGYQLVDRAVRPDPPHPLIARNGAEVEARLRQTTLYDPRLDLAVLAPDGSVAGYSLFWRDPVTGVGLTEPVRVEDEHASRGIGYAMISAGLDRLARAGATRLKIGWESERAGSLYARLGFAQKDTLLTYRR